MKTEEKAGKRDFLTVLAETKQFVSWCRDPHVQAEASELIQDAENEYVDHGPGDEAWNAMNAARRLTAESRAKFHKGMAEQAIVEAAEKLGHVRPSENGFYDRAAKALEGARTFLAESEKDERRFQVQHLKAAEEKAKSASRALDLLLAEQEMSERKRGNDLPKGSQKALKDQGHALKKDGYERGAETAERRAKGNGRGRHDEE